MDLPGALEFLKDNFNAAERAHVVPGLGDKRTAVVDLRGTLVDRPLPCPPRQHTVENIASFVQAVETYADETVTVWVSLRQSVAVLFDKDNDADHRLHRVTLPVQPSPVFESLRSLSGKQFEQKPLLRFLRHDLKPASLSPEGFDLAVAALKFATTDEQEGQFVANKKDSMGRSIRAELTGDLDKFPSLAVTFHPYPSLLSEVPEQVTVGCSVDVDVTERRIRLVPFPGELEAAQVAAVESLRKAILAGGNIDPRRVFCGTP